MKHTLLKILLLLPLAAIAQPKVVVSIKPIHDIVQAVMQDVGQPTLLLAPGASPHSYAMKPSQMRAIQDAELIIWIGPDLENFLSKPLAQIKPQKIMTLLNEHELILYPYHGEHAHGHIDPHFWLDPLNMQILADIVAVRLSEIDPENANVYRANTQLLKAELGKLNQEIADQLKPIKGKPFIVFHDAYQYFEKRYSLSPAGSITINTDIMPSAAQLLAIKQTLKKQGISCIFSEPQFSPAVVERIAAEAGVEYGTLNPIGGTEGTGFTAYAALIQQLADALLQCLQVELNNDQTTY